MKDLLALLGAAFAIVSTLPYIIDTIRRRTKPNIVSWLTWTILTLVATAASVVAHEPRTALLIGASTICTGGVVVAGLWYGTAKFSWFDGMCQAGAIAGLVLWLLLDSPTIGIIVPVAIDFVALLPTLRHSWLKPGEETWQTFLIGVFAPTFTILSLAHFTVNSLLYPFYLFTANLLIVITVVYRRRQLGISLSRSYSLSPKQGS